MIESMMSSVESNVNVTVVNQPSPQVNTVIVTESPMPSVPVVTASPAFKFQYPPLQPLGIFTFPQGILEIVLRIAICVLAFITMITAAVARANVDDITLEGPDFVDKSALRSVFGYSVAIAVFILIIFVVIVAIRVLGIGVINEFWVIFGIMDIIDSFFWAGNSFISTVVSGVGAANASGAKENCEERRIQQNLCDEYQPVAESGAAASFFSIVMCIVLVVLAVYMIIFLALKWNEKHLRTAPANSSTATNSTEPYQKMN